MNMGYDWYKKKLKPHAQQLRREMTKEERRLWYDFLKNLPITVKRQKIIDGYIVDFYIPSAKLVIELDGSQHYSDGGVEYDQERNAYMGRSFSSRAPRPRKKPTVNANNISSVPDMTDSISIRIPP